MKKIVSAIVLVLIIMVTASTTNVHAAPNQYPSEQAAKEQEMIMLQKRGPKPGTYPINVSYTENGKQVEKTIYLTITGEYTVIEDGVAIDAQPFTMDKSQVATMTSDKWVSAASARAWETASLADVPIAHVNSSQVKAEKGTYPIYFATASYVRTMVYVQVTDSTAVTTTSGSGQYTNWFQDHLPSSGFSWDSFFNISFIIFGLLLLMVVMIPLLILLFQYLTTANIIRDIINIVTK